MKYNTRIAPSPSGHLHIGNIRTAYFNWLCARSTGGKFILRVDDTNPDKSDTKYVDTIFTAFKWLGLDVDDVFYSSKRTNLYLKVANDLVDKGLATHKDGAIVLTPKTIRDSWVDDVSGTIKTSDHDIKTINNLVLIKSDGLPTYNFATVVDDNDMGINYIIRGTDHLPNTIKHIVIYDALGYDLPKFAHVGLVHDAKKKISKRDGNNSILKYKDDGIHPGALLNFVLRLGWGPYIDDKTTRVLDRDRSLDLFLDGGKMRSASSNVDSMILKSLDGRYKRMK